MYPWRLTEDVQAPVLHPELPSVHSTREELIEPVVRAQLNKSASRVIDLGGHEGYFSHRALAWGATSVVAVDVREANTRRALLLRDHYGIPPELLEIRTASVYDVRSDEVGRFDVVLLLGLIYHLEDPIGALRIAKSLTERGGLVVVESQLTRHEVPLRTGIGVTGEHVDEPAAWAARHESPEEQAGHSVAAYGGVISLIPNRAALTQSLEVIGLRNVSILQPAAHHNPQYRQGDRAVAVGWAR